MSAPQPTPTEQSLLVKYGLPAVPVVAAFGTQFAVDIVKKTLIKKVLDPGKVEPGTEPVQLEESGLTKSSALDAFEASPYGQGANSSSTTALGGGINDVGIESGCNDNTTMEITNVTGFSEWDSTSGVTDIEISTSGEELAGVGDAVVTLFDGIADIF